jgi:hypothetical protein
MSTAKGTGSLGSVWTTVTVAFGAGLATFLLVTVLVIELLAFEFSAIVALPIGLLAGVAGLLLVVLTFSDAGRIGRGLSVAAAGFGYAVLSLLAVSYVNLGGLRSDLSTTLVVTVAASVAALAFVATVLVQTGMEPPGSTQ